jgi:hypothetical protein
MDEPPFDCWLFKVYHRAWTPADSKSAAMLAVQSQAKKYVAIEKQRRKQSLQERAKDSYRSIRLALDPETVNLVTRLDAELA